MGIPSMTGKMPHWQVNVPKPSISKREPVAPLTKDETRILSWSDDATVRLRPYVGDEEIEIAVAADDGGERISACDAFSA
jgi:hypothetical protein